MQWRDDAHVLGVAEMDATHREFVELVTALASASDAGFADLFEQLAEHTRLHFEHEGKLMRECRFPAIGEHHAEHLRVLGEIAHMGTRVRAGRLATPRVWLESLPGWFETHLRTMDAALAARLKAMAAEPSGAMR
ncbi:bacteriohemerythrin [Cognatazoarcus halotolerans]|uniref:bacteriohemerythrin n=1 Tax=Cognatazoarcus halotolerans TaxID=2686016 RepID=UPI00135C38A7|nr:hemerythrin domain-containing protein [Cognatazoarcus halotolerans]MCP5308393.1 hemerythrin domain-containing protein [Zoogloeaceae bacterium]